MNIVVFSYVFSHALSDSYSSAAPELRYCSEEGRTCTLALPRCVNNRGPQRQDDSGPTGDTAAAPGNYQLEGTCDSAGEERRGGAGQGSPSPNPPGPGPRELARAGREAGPLGATGRSWCERRQPAQAGEGAGAVDGESGKPAAPARMAGAPPPAADGAARPRGPR